MSNIGNIFNGMHCVTTVCALKEMF